MQRQGVSYHAIIYAIAQCYHQIVLNDEVRIAEVRFFILLSHQDREIPLALVSIYSLPDPTLHHISVGMLSSCEYLGDSELKFIHAKTIQAVVAMVPHRPAIEGQPIQERFFLVEKPGFDVGVMSGVQEDMPLEDDSVIL